MPDNQSWIYQGRQYHGWFGSGTSPHDDIVPGTEGQRPRPLPPTGTSDMPLLRTQEGERR